MGRLNNFLLAIAATLTVSPLYAQCVYPPAIDVPDGATASNEEMISGQKAVKSYMAEMEAYLECLDKETAELTEKETPEQKAIHTQRHNAAVDAMEATAAKFNEEVREYKTATR
jgi:hypothetical protein